MRIIAMALSILCLSLAASAGGIQKKPSLLSPSETASIVGGQAAPSIPEAECTYSPVCDGADVFCFSFGENVCSNSTNSIHTAGNRNLCHHDIEDHPETDCTQGVLYNCLVQRQCYWDPDMGTCHATSNTIGSVNLPTTCTDGL
jgi:hypothetical protein